MKTTRVIIIGILIWCLGVTTFVGAYYLPILENREFQANLALLIAIVPIVWTGSYNYYKKDRKTNGLIIGGIFFLISGILDALITVPLLFAPQGGTHADFFGDPGFWMIGSIFVGITTAYYYLKVKRTQTQTL